jgi:hypothetical protein
MDTEHTSKEHFAANPLRSDSRHSYETPERGRTLSSEADHASIRFQIPSW